MTLSDLLIACASGEMPMVKYQAEGGLITGRVVQIKNGIDGYGCWVDAGDYYLWFDANYTFGYKMSELTLATDGREGE